VNPTSLSPQFSFVAKTIFKGELEAYIRRLIIGQHTNLLQSQAKAASSILDLEGLHHHWGVGDGTYVIVTLQGAVKGESIDRDHLLPCVFVTLSGVNVKASLKRLMDLKAGQGFTNGPAISDLGG
jgi:hypothetical protein